MSHLTLWLWSTQLKSHLAKTGGHCRRKSGDYFFCTSHDPKINKSHDSGGEGGGLGPSVGEGRFPHPKSQSL